MITSIIWRGLIYAGDTPLALTIIVEQTGPMQLTVRAGSFTSTGQARIRPYTLADDALIAAGFAESLPDRQRVREWIERRDGTLDKAKTYTLAVEQVINLTSDPLKPVAYDVDLISNGTQTGVLVKRKVVGVEEYSDPPLGWQKVHELLFEFVLPPGCADVTTIDIYALTVKPGFPSGTGADGWKMQTGGI